MSFTLSVLYCLQGACDPSYVCCILLTSCFVILFGTVHFSTFKQRLDNEAYNRAVVLNAHEERNISFKTLPLGDVPYTVVRGSLLQRRSSTVGDKKLTDTTKCGTQCGADHRMESDKADKHSNPLAYADRVPPPSQWPQRPLYIRYLECVECKTTHDTIEDCIGQTVCEFETSLFKGRTLIRLSSHQTSQRRSGPPLMSVLIQGQFKERLNFAEVMTGQVFERPFSQLPPEWLVKYIMRSLQQINLSSKHDIKSNHPFIIAPLAAAATTLHVSSCEKAAPDIARHGVRLEENTTLLGGVFSSEPVSAENRVTVLASPTCLEQYYFTEGNIHTFYFEQNIFDLSTFEIDTNVGRVDLARYLQDQPIQISAFIPGRCADRNTQFSTRSDTLSPNYLWRIEIWHEKLLRHEV